MIPQYILDAWRKSAPWQSLYQIEQDMIICRAIIDIFSNPNLNTTLAFRGGTALHKIFNLAETRYSEDIDLVVCQKGPAGILFDSVQKSLNPWLGKPTRVLKEGRANIVYKFATEDSYVSSAKLKIEINTIENICIDGFVTKSFSHKSDWFTGTAQINTFSLNELLATKLRALYQRKKGRDLFDIYFALQSTDADSKRIIDIFLHYMEFSKNKVSRAQFEQNMHEKIRDKTFLGDVSPLLVNEKTFYVEDAFENVMDTLIAKLPGDSWKKKP